MAFELMEQIKKAESQAEQLRQDALKEGRDILKTAQEVCVALEKDAEKDIRKAYQDAMETGRQKVLSLIESNTAAREAQRSAMTDRAMAKQQKAVDHLVREVLK